MNSLTFPICSPLMCAKDLSADEILYSAALVVTMSTSRCELLWAGPKTPKVRSFNRFGKEFYKQVTHSKFMDKPLE